MWTGKCIHFHLYGLASWWVLQIMCDGVSRMQGATLLAQHPSQL